MNLGLLHSRIREDEALLLEQTGRDSRVGADIERIAETVRTADHRLTNVANGGRTERFEVADEVRGVVEPVSAVVGGGLPGVDLMETGSGYTVHEVNSTCEWTKLDRAVPAVDDPARSVDWIDSRAGEVAA